MVLLDPQRGFALRELVKWSLGRRIRLKVVGQSMKPVLAEGEFVLARLLDPAAEGFQSRSGSRRGFLKVGQIVVAAHPQAKDIRVIKRLDHFDSGTGDVYLRSDNPSQGTDSSTWGYLPSESVSAVVTLNLSRPTSDLAP